MFGLVIVGRWRLLTRAALLPELAANKGVGPVIGGAMTDPLERDQKLYGDTEKSSSRGNRIAVV